jgi:LacI family transcriptional regulator
MRSLKKVTVFDVAKRAGVSHTAVSMALRGSKEIGAEQAKKICALAEKLGYYPKAAAQMLRSGRTGYLGIIMAGSSVDVIAETGFGGLILAHFLDQCQSRSIRNSVEFFKLSEHGRFEPPHSLAGSLVDGVVLAGFVDAELRDWLSKQPRYPWVSIDEPAQFSVLCSSDKGVAEAVHRLASLGHKRIAFWGGPTCFNTHRLELEGFRRAVAQSNMDIRSEHWVKNPEPPNASFNANDMAGWAHKLLTGNSRPTAFICHGPECSREVIRSAGALGLSVPKDLSIYCFGGATDARANTPYLSTIEVDFPSMVNEAMTMLLSLLERKQVQPRTAWFQPHIVERETVAVANSRFKD